MDIIKTMTPSRRGFLAGLFCAPAIICIDNLMPVKLIPVLESSHDRVVRLIAERLKVHDELYRRNGKFGVLAERFNDMNTNVFYEGYDVNIINDINNHHIVPKRDTSYRNYPEYKYMYNDLAKEMKVSFL